ncbi:MAG TPA: queuosine precursor transporter [Allosphingosinicella sp.]|nr:queuosine precursor transporter [Allosphingosinicella sp.]
MSTRAPISQPGAPAIPRSLFAYSIFYGGMVCIAGVLANKQVALGPLGVEAGIFAFLLLVVASSAVAELFGRETANRLVLIGFAPLIFSILLAIFVLNLPAAQDMPADRLAAFDTIMRGTPRIWIAGIIAYGVSQFLNVTIFSALRGKGEGRVVWLRAGIAAVLSQIVDTLLFITISFYGVFPITDLLVGQMIAKVVLSIVLVPPLVALAVAFGRRLDGPSAAPRA